MNAVAYCFAEAMEPEATIVARGLRKRDPDLLDYLIEKYQHRLLRYLFYLSGNRDVAEDLFQETWIRVMERGHQYNGRHEFSTWLYAVARNLAMDYLRRKDPVSLEGLNADDEHAPLEPVDTRPSAWDLVAQDERTDNLRSALMSLPAEYREAIVLRFYDGLALQEIAGLTASPVSTVKSRVYRGLGMMMERLKGTHA